VRRAGFCRNDGEKDVEILNELPLGTEESKQAVTRNQAQIRYHGSEVAKRN
jgi:hypothetical protein